MADERGPSGTGHDTARVHVPEGVGHPAAPGEGLPAVTEAAPARSYMLFDRASGNAMDSYDDVAAAHDGLRRAVEASPAEAETLVLIGFDAAGMPVGDSVALADLAAPDLPVAAPDPAGIMDYIQSLPVPGKVSEYRKRAEAIRALAALLVERQQADARRSPVPTDAGGPGKEETYWLRQKLQAAVQHLRDIEDYYRLAAPSGPYNEQRADRARVLYEQIVADFINGKMTVPPEIVSLRAARQQAEERIERLTEALGDLVLLMHSPQGIRLRAVEAACAVLAGEEDARG